MPPATELITNNPATNLLKILPTQTEQAFHNKYLKEFRVEQCPLFLQHKCQQHRPFTCFNWHFQNQRRRKPVKQKDGFFNYSSDIYCTKYDEATGICPDGDGCALLHRTSGDTERRYHLKYYKTSLCVHSSDSRGFCIKNGPHCAFGHGNNDLRLPVKEIKDKSYGDNDTDHQNGNSSSQSEKEQRSNVPDDPKWRDTQFVILHYKTEFCKKPPRLCRQGYACPYYHNGKDKRRSYLKIRYRSTPCPNVKSGDEWGDPAVCEAGDDCMYCHTRTEQQFHPEIYKSTKCNDMASQSYCPRGVYCAFAHSDKETVTTLGVTSPETAQSNNGNYTGDFSVKSVSSDEGLDNAEAPTNNQSGAAPGSGKRVRSQTPPFEENGISSPIDLPVAKPANVVSTCSLASSFESGLGAISTYSNKNRFLSGDNVSSNREPLIRRQLFTLETDHLLSGGEGNQRKSNMMMDINTALPTNLVQTFSKGDSNPFLPFDPIEPVANYFDELAIDPFDGNKSRKSSGFSETTTKSRQFSGYEQNKSRNCSGNSGSPGYLTNGYLNGSSPMMIPNSGNPSPQGNSPPTNAGNGFLQKDTLENINLNSTLGLFELGNGCMKAPSSPGSDSSITHNMKDAEIKQLKDELTKSLARLATWEENMSHARAACEAWKNESVKISKKLEEALRDKENALAKVSHLQKELDTLTMESMHRSRILSNLKAQPLGQLKAIEWKLKTDLNEVEQIIHAHSESAVWISNARLFDFPNDWMNSSPQALFGPLTQQ